MIRIPQELQESIENFEQLWKQTIEWAAADASRGTLSSMDDLASDAIQEFQNEPFAADFVSTMKTSREIIRMRRAELDAATPSA